MGRHFQLQKNRQRHAFLKQDGLRFDFGTAGKMQEVIDLISTKGIKEE